MKKPDIEAVKDQARKVWRQVERKQRDALKVARECQAQLIELERIIRGPEQKPAA